MSGKEDFKNGLSLVGGAISDYASILAEKSKIRAQQIRIKQIIKSDTKTKNKAFEDLGKFFYENLRESANEDNEALCAIVDKMNARIEKASVKYVELEQLQTDTKFKSENADKLKDFTSEKASEVKAAAKEKTTEAVAKTKDFAADKYEKAKDFATEKFDQAKDFATEKYDEIKVKAEDVKDNVGEKFVDVKEAVGEKVDQIKDKVTVKETDVEELIKSEAEKLQTLEQTAVSEPVTEVVEEVKEEIQEESPENFEF